MCESHVHKNECSNFGFVYFCLDFPKIQYPALANIYTTKEFNNKNKLKNWSAKLFQKD